MEEQSLAAFKGGEKEFNVKMFSDEKNKIMHGRLVPGASIGYHVHHGNCKKCVALHRARIRIMCRSAACGR